MPSEAWKIEEDQPVSCGKGRFLALSKGAESHLQLLAALDMAPEPHAQVPVDPRGGGKQHRHGSATAGVALGPWDLTRRLQRLENLRLKAIERRWGLGSRTDMAREGAERSLAGPRLKARCL